MKIISKDYLNQQIELHTNPNYGVMSIKHAPDVAKFALDNECNSILDYGAGKQRLRYGLYKGGYKGWYTAYDPAVLSIKNIKPSNYDLLVCVDVLEHIEPELLDNVLDHMHKNMTKYGYFTVATGSAKKILKDGRNAHLIQQPFKWWKPKLEERWELSDLVETSHGFKVIAKIK
tara:strand:- start:304 stop:825 length:522 start_codon:yes stop_codon:yes gene_type:complete